jgi:8-amino-7-oxononanoate synthase
VKAQQLPEKTFATQPTALGGILADELKALHDAGLYRVRARIDGKQGARVSIGGREYVSFASNDYLGLAADPRIAAAARKGLERYGVGAGASHLLYGHGQAHEALEAALARFVGYPRALVFPTGYMANLGVVTALCGRGDEVFADKLNHASLNDAMLLSRARFRRYPHLDLERLEHGLSASRARRKLVVTDAVFSMDGDIAPVPELVALCERYGALLLLDDAHGFGVLGRHGGGVLEHYGLASERIVYMGTLGKAAGVYGAFVAADTALVELLVNRARSYIYTTAAPQLLAVALMESLAIVASEDERRSQLARLIARLGEARDALPGTLLPSSTPIQPLVLGAADAATRAMRLLSERGLVVPAVRPPTVPRGSARLRISFSAAHSIADVERLIGALRALPR